MTKQLKCSDIGFECGYEAKAETEDGILQQVASHAKEVHGIETIPPEVVEKAKQAIREI